MSSQRLLSSSVCEANFVSNIELYGRNLSVLQDLYSEGAVIVKMYYHDCPNCNKPFENLFESCEGEPCPNCNKDVLKLLHSSLVDHNFNPINTVEQKLDSKLTNHKA